MKDIAELGADAEAGGTNSGAGGADLKLTLARTAKPIPTKSLFESYFSMSYAFSTVPITACRNFGLGKLATEPLSSAWTSGPILCLRKSPPLRD